MHDDGIQELSTRPSHKAWRKVAKKERRRRLRREAAREREADEARLRAALERSAEYLNWLEEQEKVENEREEREQREHEERERLWLEEEVRAQKEWEVLQEKKARARQQQLEQEAKIREEFEAKQEAIRRKKAEEKRRRDEEIQKQEELQKEIDDYIDNGIKTPEVLREVIDSQPGKELCPFFTKTGACRYGDTCSRNHRRVCLSRVILVPGFYSHFSLEKNSAEYDTDIGLEYESSETRQHFREFYKDVVPELESYGRIKTLKLCCNSEVHLRGNLYAEYYSEREAARALRALKGRWYAGRQLNCEFANLQSWRSAVCGMQKCPKGRACNFLHVFRNPRDEYDIKSPPRRAKATPSAQDAPTSRRSNRSKWEDSVRGEHEDERNWRWSESPEMEATEHHHSSEKRHRRSDERDRRRSSRRERKREDSARKHSARSSRREREECEERVRKSQKSRASKSRRRRHGEDEEEHEESKSRRRRRKIHVSANGRGHRDEKIDKPRNNGAGKSNEPSELGKNTDKKLETSEKVVEEEEKDKSKWDLKEFRESSSSSSEADSADSESSKSPQDKEFSSAKRRKVAEESSKYEWDTTDSETDSNKQ